MWLSECTECYYCSNILKPFLKQHSWFLWQNMFATKFHKVHRVYKGFFDERCISWKRSEIKIWMLLQLRWHFIALYPLWHASWHTRINHLNWNSFSYFLKLQSYCSYLDLDLLDFSQYCSELKIKWYILIWVSLIPNKHYIVLICNTSVT